MEHIAVVAWKVFVKKYSKFKYGLNTETPALIAPAKLIVGQPACSNEIIEINKSKPSSKPSNGVLENVITQRPESPLYRSENRRSKSKVRTYIKKCKNVLKHHATLSHQSNDQPPCPTTHEAITQNSTCYLDSVVINQSSINIENNNSIETTVFIESSIRADAEYDGNEDIDNLYKSDVCEINCRSDILNRTYSNSQTLEDDTLVPSTNSSSNDTDVPQTDTICTVANLVDKYLVNLYPKRTIDHTRSVLIREARDLLVCTFHGNLTIFEEEFLSPAVILVSNIKQSCNHDKANLHCLDGWPLAVNQGVVLHLGDLDESLVRPQDLYVCIKPNNGLGQPILCASWRSTSQLNTVHCQQLDPRIDCLSPIAIEMLSEELPQLLQNLLIGVERTINRIRLEELSFPLKDNGNCIVNDSSYSNSLSNISGSPKCGLKRRELITRNKVGNSKYALRRMSNKIDTTEPKGSTDTSANIASSDNLHNVSMPLFCLGGSFPHIDSDEESGDDSFKNEESRFPHDIVAPRSIKDLPEKLLMSGIYLPGNRNVSGSPIISIEADKVYSSGVNCYEIATVLLYYSTIPINVTPFCIHLIITDKSQLNVLDLLDNSLHLIRDHIKVTMILVSCLFRQILSDKSSTAVTSKDRLPSSSVKLVFTNNLSDFMAAHRVPIRCGGTYEHNQQEWREFFMILEPLQIQCLTVGRRLVEIMGEIRASDNQGIPTRRQLYTQHRALSRALMDQDLQNLRRKGPETINRLSEFVKSADRQTYGNVIKEESGPSSSKSSSTNNIIEQCSGNNTSDYISCSNVGNDTSNENEENMNKTIESYDLVTVRLNEVVTIYDEVDRAARRLEQLTEHRRERLRELTRQRALEEEINEVVNWIKNDGDETLTKFMNVQLDCETAIKDDEYEFEKFYFISMQHLAKGRDLEDAASDILVLKECSQMLQDSLSSYSIRLECTRERIEGAARLHHLLGLHLPEDDVQIEMKKLAEKIGAPNLMERCKDLPNDAEIRPPVKINATSSPISSSKNRRIVDSACNCWRDESEHIDSSPNIDCSADDDEEDRSKIADSGLGGCSHCEGDDNLMRSCSCQSFEDPTNTCSKSHNSDDLEDDCFENSSKQMLDLHSPLQPNAHLYCNSSNLDLPNFEDGYGLDPKTQKTLLLIMREMIGTERDYVRSLQYVIENYIKELDREDIPQSLRGQRNVIFGNVEKIYEFHQQHFLQELELCENNPLKVGAAFLEHESKFYLYALYNKNKPKSDSLMSEYGTNFFKAKQFELDDKMDLASYLLKPVQRMGKYALLLQQLMKAVTSVQGPSLNEITEDLDELQKAEEMVRFQLRHGNDLLAMDSLRDLDVNVKEQGRLLRQNEFLVWQGRGGKKSLRQVFLFEELVLFSKARRFPDRKNLDIYLYKNSIKTSDIGLTAHVGDSPTKFEIWFRKRKPDDTWTLQSMNEDIKNVWADEISKLLWKQAKRNRDIRLAEMSSMGIGNKPCLDIRPSRNQINDRSITISQLEKAPKFRNSFSGTLPDVKSSRRPNSIISLGSSFSSGTSSSSLSTNTSLSSGGSHSKNTNNIGLELINETMPLQTCIMTHIRKHQRSVTLVSQLSMESGIIADVSISPDTDSTSDQQPQWPIISHSNSDQRLSTTTQQQISVTESVTNSSDPYSDSITVHL